MNVEAEWYSEEKKYSYMKPQLIPSTLNGFEPHATAFLRVMLNMY